MTGNLTRGEIVYAINWFKNNMPRLVYDPHLYVRGYNGLGKFVYEDPTMAEVYNTAINALEKAYYCEGLK